MPGKGTKGRKRAAISDVRRWVEYAIASGSSENPFPEADKRHALFASKLAHAREVEARFDDLLDAYGTDPSTLTRRAIPRPPLLTWEQLSASAL